MCDRCSEEVSFLPLAAFISGIIAKNAQLLAQVIIFYYRTICSWIPIPISQQIPRIIEL
jgi:hypothetical protein